MSEDIIRVLVVDDSAVAREFLAYLLGSDPGIQLIGTACSGEEALEMAESRKPDVITMDINMPTMGGIEATRRIMEDFATPVVIVSGHWDPEDVRTSLSAMESGALAVIKKPAGIGDPNHKEMAAQFIQTVKLMAEVKVVTRRKRLQPSVEAGSAPASQADRFIVPRGDFKIVAVGASTGGPLILQRLLCGLKFLPMAMVIVQHMSPGFIHGFAEWLAKSTAKPVHVAENREFLLPGHIYVAPDEYHMAVEAGGRVALSKEKPEEGIRPSVSHLYRSVADAFGPKAIGILLTGMGKDGAAGLKIMRERGAITIVQDRESSIVYGMPGEALRLGGAEYVLAPEKIAAMLRDLSGTA